MDQTGSDGGDRLIKMREFIIDVIGYACVWALLPTPGPEGSFDKGEMENKTRDLSSTRGLSADDETEVKKTVAHALVRELYEYQVNVIPLADGLWNLKLVVHAESLEAATSKAVGLVDHATAKAGLHDWSIERISTSTLAQVEKDLTELRESAPLVGVAELADMLGVTRQRASQIAHEPKFPRPIQRLRSGPVFNRHHVERYIRRQRKTPRHSNEAFEDA